MKIMYIQKKTSKLTKQTIERRRQSKGDSNHWMHTKHNNHQQQQHELINQSTQSKWNEI
jgi:hypothetical protein